MYNKALRQLPRVRDSTTVQLPKSQGLHPVVHYKELDKCSLIKRNEWSGLRGRMLEEHTENLKKKSPTSVLFFTLASIKSGDCHILVDVKSAYLQGDKMEREV